jgi:predicted small secreted protein
MKHRSILWLAVLLACLSLYACNMPSPQGEDGQTGNVQTWIDAPLDGSTIPFAPYEIVVHAYDPAGVTQVELKANGSMLATLPNPNTGQLLTTLKYLWSPAAPGNYTLGASAQSSNGAWGSATTIMVTVTGSTATPVIAVIDSGTPTLVDTLTPTLVPTTTPSATPVPAELSFTPRISNNQFYYGSCGSDQVTIQVYVSGGNAYSVVLFTQLQGAGWDEGSGMTPSGDGWFSRTVSSRSLDGAKNVDTATLLYQFVATGSSSQVIGRSQVYSDITLTACAQEQPPEQPPVQPPSGITPVRPPNVPPIFVRPTATLIPPPK